MLLLFARWKKQMEKFIIKDFEPAYIPDVEKILKEEYSAEKKKVPFFTILIFKNVHSQTHFFWQ